MAQLPVLHQLEGVMADGKADNHQGGCPDHQALDQEPAEVDAAARALGRLGSDGIFAGGALSKNHGTPPVAGAKRECVQKPDKNAGWSNVYTKTRVACGGKSSGKEVTS